jgi:hypothetical protein
MRERWIKLHNVKLQYLYSLPNMIRMIKSRRMREKYMYQHPWGVRKYKF